MLQVRVHLIELDLNSATVANQLIIVQILFSISQNIQNTRKYIPPIHFSGKRNQVRLASVVCVTVYLPAHIRTSPCDLCTTEWLRVDAHKLFLMIIDGTQPHAHTKVLVVFVYVAEH